MNSFSVLTLDETALALQTAEFFALRAGNAGVGDLALLLLQVSERDPLTGDESPR